MASFHALFSLSNDNLYLLTPPVRAGNFPGDDNGFTNDATLRVGLDRENDGFGLDLRHRMITERRERWSDEHLRVDQLDVVATYQRITRLEHVKLTTSASVGAVVLGNLGGRAVQQYWHSGPLVYGRTIGFGLQDTYQGGTTVSPLLGLGFNAAYEPWRFLRLSAEAHAQGSPLAMSDVSLEPRVRLNAPFVVSPYIGASVKGVCQVIHDPRLSIPGGYVPGCYLAPTVNAGVEVGPVSAELELRANEGGAGSGIGEVKLGLSF